MIISLAEARSQDFSKKLEQAVHQTDWAFVNEGTSLQIETWNGSKLSMKLLQCLDQTLYLCDELGSLAVIPLNLVKDFTII